MKPEIESKGFWKITIRFNNSAPPWTAGEGSQWGRKLQSSILPQQCLRNAHVRWGNGIFWIKTKPNQPNKNLHLSHPDSALCAGGQRQSMWYSWSPLPGVESPQLKLLQGLTGPLNSANRDMLRCTKYSITRWQSLQNMTFSWGRPYIRPQLHKYQVVSWQLCTQGVASRRVAVGTSHQPLTQWRSSIKQGLFSAEDYGALCSLVPSNCSAQTEQPRLENQPLIWLHVGKHDTPIHSPWGAQNQGKQTQENISPLQHTQSRVITA